MKAYPLPYEILSIKECASKDTTRYALRGILLDVANKKIVATNGHIMQYVEFEPKIKENIIIPQDAFKGLTKNVVLIINGKYHFLAQTDILQREPFEVETIKKFEKCNVFAPVEAEYPNYIDILPNKNDAVYNLCLGVEVLNTLIKAVKKGRNRSIVFAMDSTGLKAINTIITGSNLKGIIMPSRTDDNRIGLL